MTRPIVLMRKDVAANWYHRPWSEVIEYAKGGEDGLALTVQPSSDGYWLWKWIEDEKGAVDMKQGTVRKELTPDGWASFYLGTDHKPNTCVLHVQNY